MSFTGTGSAAFRITGFEHGSHAYAGKIRTMFEFIITDEVIQMDAINYPGSRPVDNLDQRQTLSFLDLTSFLPPDTDAASTTTSFSEANGSGNGTLVAGDMVPRSVRHAIVRRNGGNPMEQDFYLEGEPTFTTSV